MEILLGALAIAVAYAFSSLRILKQYERGVTFLLGKGIVNLVVDRCGPACGCNDCSGTRGCTPLLERPVA